MNITYLGHSGFSVETSDAYYIFDYIRGELPEFDKDKKIYIFVSHAHQDHWKPDLYEDERLRDAAMYILGFDIRETFAGMTCRYPFLTQIPLTCAYPLQEIRTGDFTCTPILSTDEGVAFLIRTKNETIYHAGDLNWWHWNVDPAERNRERAVNFKRDIDRMKGVHIDAAFAPLDPRQEYAYRYCMDYCLETLDADHVFPMHFWEKYDLCATYHESLKLLHPDWYERFQPIAFQGEKFTV